MQYSHFTQFLIQCLRPLSVSRLQQLKQHDDSYVYCIVAVHHHPPDRINAAGNAIASVRPFVSTLFSGLTNR